MPRGGMAAGRGDITPDGESWEVTEDGFTEGELGASTRPLRGFPWCLPGEERQPRASSLFVRCHPLTNHICTGVQSGPRWAVFGGQPTVPSQARYLAVFLLLSGCLIPRLIVPSLLQDDCQASVHQGVPCGRDSGLLAVPAP